MKFLGWVGILMSTFILLSYFQVGYSIPIPTDVYSYYYFKAEFSRLSYPLEITDIDQPILLRRNIQNNITLYLYGYRPTEFTVNLNVNTSLNIDLEPSTLFTVDLIAPGYPDLPMATYKVRDGYNVLGLTSMSGKGHVYIPFDSGDEVEINAMPPQELLYWMNLINLSFVEPYLRNFRPLFEGYEYIAPMVPAPIVDGVDTDYTVYTSSGQKDESKTLLMGTSRVLDGYVYTQSGEPLKNAIVALRPERFYRYIYTFTDENGYYRFSNYVGPGKYYISVIYRGYILPRQTLFIFSSDYTYNLTLPDFRVVEGYFTDKNGRPLPNALLAIQGGGSSSIAYTDSNGYFRLYVPWGDSEYLLLQKWSDVWLADQVIPSSRFIDGFENITGEVYTVDVNGVLKDSTSNNLLGTPVVRFQGVVDNINLYITVDYPVEAGEFNVRLPSKINFMGIYWNVTWTVNMVDYYYYGNQILAPTHIFNDLNLGIVNLDRPDLVELKLILNPVEMPSSTPIETYLFQTWYKEIVFNISIDTNSTFVSTVPGVFRLDGSSGNLTFKVLIPYNMSSILTISIPKDMMSSPYVILVNGKPYSYDFVMETGTHVYIRLYLDGGEKEIIIKGAQVISEFYSVYLYIMLIILTSLILFIRKISDGR